MLQQGFKHVGFADVIGGGQVVVDGTTAYIAHMFSPHQNTIVDVKDPKHPKVIAEVPLGWGKGVHAHKVRVKDGIMLTNLETVKYQGEAPPEFTGGMNIYDVSNPAKPRHLKKWDCARDGVHRFTFDGRYAYTSPCIDGYHENITMILDLKNPEKPEEVGRWHYPGQWYAGGEERNWNPKHPPRTHHPIRVGDHLFTSYWHGGFAIIDISDMSKPKTVSIMNWTKQFTYPVHTCLPIPFEIEGRRLMLVTDEDALPRTEPAPGSLVWLVDISDLSNPIPFSTFRVDGMHGQPQGMHSTCHQPAEEVRGTEIPVAYFQRGLVMVDISDPHRMKEVARYTPDHAPGKHVISNDLHYDDRGLIYLLDRVNGLSIVERKNGAGPKSISGTKATRRTPAMAARRAVKAPARKRPAAKKAPARKTAAKKAPARKTAAKKAPARRTAAAKAPARKTATRKTPARKTATKKAPARKAAAKKAPARKPAAKKAPVRKTTTARKTTARKAPARRTARTR